MLTMLKSKGGYVFEYEDSEAVANETANINTECLHTQRDTASKREIGGLSGNLFKSKTVDKRVPNQMKLIDGDNDSFCNVSPAKTLQIDKKHTPSFPKTKSMNIRNSKKLDFNYHYKPNVKHQLNSNSKIKILKKSDCSTIDSSINKGKLFKIPNFSKAESIMKNNQRFIN